MLIDVGYMGARGVHLTLYDINSDQIPDQYLSMGNALLNQVPNPFYGIIPASAGVLGQKTVAQGYLLRPYPQYLYTSIDAPSVGESAYNSLQVKVQKRFKGGGILMGSYTFSHMTSDADVLSPWLEASRYNVGGGQGVQDNTNIKGGEIALKLQCTEPPDPELRSRSPLRQRPSFPDVRPRTLSKTSWGLEPQRDYHLPDRFPAGADGRHSESSGDRLRDRQRWAWTTRSGREPAELHRRLRQELSGHNAAGPPGGMVQHFVLHAAGSLRVRQRAAGRLRHAVRRRGEFRCGSFEDDGHRRKDVAGSFEPRPTTFSTGCSSARPTPSRGRPPSVR